VARAIPPQGAPRLGERQRAESRNVGGWVSPLGNSLPGGALRMGGLVRAESRDLRDGLEGEQVAGNDAVISLSLPLPARAEGVGQGTCRASPGLVSPPLLQEICAAGERGPVRPSDSPRAVPPIPGRVCGTSPAGSTASLHAAHEGGPGPRPLLRALPDELADHLEDSSVKPSSICSNQMY
jgi:hypothetical protein